MHNNNLPPRGHYKAICDPMNHECRTAIQRRTQYVTCLKLQQPYTYRSHVNNSAEAALFSTHNLSS